MKKIQRLILGLSTLLWFTGCQNSIELSEEVKLALEQAPDKIDYNLHIKPILSDRCFKCHGPDKNKIEAGLQLASFEGATQENKQGRKAIVPGNIGKSELVKRILSHDPDEVMPTPGSNLTLTNEEKAVLLKWIEQGAEYREHWSLTKIQKPEVPKAGKSFPARLSLVEDEETKWVRNEIDRFVLDKMKQLKLHPSPEANKTTLLRRVYMDITGLPPTPEEVAAFLKDTSPDAYEKVVDKMLKSPHFGEQQAISWLDLARYADSHGYQDDGMRNAFPYRDWVISAFNRNLPFDQFIKYQLAGDLMTQRNGRPPTKDMLIATSFNRQHPQSQEGGIIPEEYRTEYVIDRVNTFGKGMLGLTFECARCHDHKYDPISQKDFYQLYAFFNTNNENGQVPYNGEPSPHITLSTPKTGALLNFIHKKLKNNEVIRTQDSTQAYIRFKSWLKMSAKDGLDLKNLMAKELVIDINFEKQTSLKFISDNITDKIKRKTRKVKVGSKSTDQVYFNAANDSLPMYIRGDLNHPLSSVAGPVGNAVFLGGDSYLELKGPTQYRDDFPNPGTVSGWFDRYNPFTVALWVKIVDPKLSGPLFNRNMGAFSGYRGYQCDRLPDGRINFKLSSVWPDDALEVETSQKLPLNQWTHIGITYDGSSKAGGLQIYINGKKSSIETINDNLAQSTVFGKNKTFRRSMVYNFALGQLHDLNIKGYGIDELKVYGRALSSLELKILFTGKNNELNKLLQRSLLKITAKEERELFAFYLSSIDPKTNINLRIRQQLLKEETELLNKEVDVMVMRERKTKPKTYILQRGVYDDHGEEVYTETPSKLGKLPAGYPHNRLGLAMWLLDEKNPLFARVAVNRIWQQFFGNGLVKTQEDFGNQGDFPSHLELLDWLAIRFREDGWNTKTFVRRLVLSTTYRQSSKATKDEMEKDPDNKWLTRGSSYRFTAEQIRDNALAASGLLVRKIGGPSVYPYQPEGIWEALATRNVTAYRQQHGDSLYRRSMYTIWKRSSPPPMMLNFDSPDRSSCTVRRQKTATPLQALVTLNDPQFVEAARVLAERTMKKEATLEARITYFFQAVISRSPRPQELNLMKQLYEMEYKGFKNIKSRTESLLSMGEFPRDKTLNPVEVAAFTIVANTILNYDEAIVKR